MKSMKVNSFIGFFILFLYISNAEVIYPFSFGDSVADKSSVSTTSNFLWISKVI